MYHTNSKLDNVNRFPGSGEIDMFQTPLTFNQTTMAHSSSSTETSPDSFPDLTSHQFPDFRLEVTRPEFYRRNLNREHENRLEVTRKPDFYRQNLNREHENQRRHDDSFRSENMYQSQQRPETAYEPIRPFEGQMLPEMAFRTQHPDLSNFTLTEHIYDTPQSGQRQRPIMGRNIMATDKPQKPIGEFSWQLDMAQTPPKSLEKYTPNIYELFPSENKGFEFPSPVKSSNTSPQLGTPPRVPMTPRTSTPVTSPPRSPFSSRMSTPFKEPLIGPNMSFTSNYGASKMCTFCRKNGETPLVYMTHTVKVKVGNKNVVTCPILRSHVCSTCGASGDNAHTITYCPVLRSSNNGQPLQSTTITLKNTRVKSNGRRRY